MSLTSQIAKHIRDVHVGDNWTAVNLKDNLEDVSWQQAVTPVHSLNTIAMLVYHMNYYVVAVINVLRGNKLDASDKNAFDLTPIESEDDWESLVNKTWADAETLASLIEQLPEEKLWQNMADAQYGNLYRNVHGIVEHVHYHLGQIVLIKKMLQQVSVKETT